MPSSKSAGCRGVQTRACVGPHGAGQVEIGKLHAKERGLASAGVAGEPVEVGDSSVRGGVDGVEQPREFLGRHEPLALLLGDGLHAPGEVCSGEVEVSRRDASGRWTRDRQRSATYVPCARPIRPRRFITSILRTVKRRRCFHLAK